MKSKLKINFIYSISYQILTVLLPLITAPYIARRLGANCLGIYSKTQAFANYFYLFALLGVNNYGNRAIARVRDNKYDTSKTFWEIYSFQLICSVVVLSIYVGFCLVFEHDDKLIVILQGLYVFSGMFEINWVCYGLEKFKLTTIRSTIVRLLVVIGVFTFVHDKNDIGIYTIIMSLSYVLSAFAVWPYVLKHLVFVKPTWYGIKKHIKPNLVLFLPVIAISLYNIMDKILMGVFCTNEEVAFYSNAERIVTIPTTLILALDNVVMPRMSNIYAKKDTEQAQKLMSYVMLFAMFMAAAMSFGLAGVSDVFAPWFYGAEFVRCGFFIFLLAPTILFKGWAGALRTQFLIPTGRDKIYIISLIAGAIVNLILDITLIPLMNGVGAIIGTLAAEFSVAFIQFTLCRKDIPLKEYLGNGIAFVLIGFIMFIFVEGIDRIGLGVLFTLLIQISLGAVIYITLASIYMIVTKQPVLVNEVLKMLRIKKRF